VTTIERLVMPKNEMGNDASDHRCNPNIWNEAEKMAIDPAKELQLTPTEPDNEDDIALRFSERYQDILRYVAEQGRWFIWRNNVWANDRDLSVFDMLRNHCRSLLAADNTLRKKLLNAGTIAATERLIKSDRRHAATVEQWDSNDWILNTPGGIIDLKTGAVSPNDPDQHCTKITAVGPGDDCPVWKNFLNEVTGGDTDLAEYLQRVIGYACTGSTKEHALFFFYGTGGNGKGTFLNPIMKILNDYAVIAGADVFTDSKHERHPTELAALVGARLVVAQETDEGRKWAEAKIKSITGGDPITARYMRQDFFTFTPKFSLIIAGNHKPSIQTVDEAMRRRLHLVPFNVTIPKSNRDPDLPEKLDAELQGIMQWMIDGVVEYNKQGLSPPLSVLEATEGYFEDENTLEQWISDCCSTGSENWETPTILFNSWKAFAIQANLPPGTNKDFKSKLEAAGYRYVRTGKRGRHYQGIKVRHGLNHVTGSEF
jgi:putative DNA primase/helicase